MPAKRQGDLVQEQRKVAPTYMDMTGTKSKISRDTSMNEQHERLQPADWLAALPDLKKAGSEHHGPCPVCGGTDRFRVNDKGAFCRKGCSFQDIRQAVFGDASLPAQAAEKRYKYYKCEAPDGKTAVHVRLDSLGRPKQVWWDKKPPEPYTFKTENFLYFPPNANREGTTCIICEGEKDADATASALPDHRVIGTVTGAATAPAPHTLAWGLSDAERVILWPDADTPGLAHMRQVAQRLPYGSETLWANTDGLSSGQGAADCLPEDRRRRVRESAEQAIEQETVNIDRPLIAPLSTWKDEPEPAPVLWRDADDRHADAVLSIGEVALLTAPIHEGRLSPDNPAPNERISAVNGSCDDGILAVMLFGRLFGRSCRVVSDSRQAPPQRVCIANLAGESDHVTTAPTERAMRRQSSANGVLIGK